MAQDRRAPRAPFGRRGLHELAEYPLGLVDGVKELAPLGFRQGSVGRPATSREIEEADRAEPGELLGALANASSSFLSTSLFQSLNFFSSGVLDLSLSASPMEAKLRAVLWCHGCLQFFVPNCFPRDGARHGRPIVSEARLYGKPVRARDPGLEVSRSSGAPSAAGSTGLQAGRPVAILPHTRESSVSREPVSRAKSDVMTRVFPDRASPPNPKGVTMAKRVMIDGNTAPPTSRTRPTK